MRKLITFLFFLLPTSIIFSQQHDHNDEKVATCRAEKTSFVRRYLFKKENKVAFMANYHIALEDFFRLNPIYTESMVFLISDGLCKNVISEKEITDSVYQFIQQNQNNLLFEDSKGLFGEKLLGKYIYEGNSTNPVFPLAAGDPCTNPDFSSNNYNGWQTLCGTTNGTAYTVVGATQYVPGNNAACGNTQQHAIFTGGTDPIVPSIQCVNPNGPLGGASVRIGDGTGSGSRGAVLKQTFLVSAASSAFSYSYAAILENPGYPSNQQPFFKATIYDQNNNPITCGQYQAYAGDGQTGWVNMGSYVYKNWSTAFVDLTAYIGQNVTVEFTVGDCSPSAHYAYAYVQAACTSLDITMSAPAICNGQAVTISAPSSAQNYLWNTGHNTRNITVTIPGTYTVNLTPNNAFGPNCGLTLSVMVPSAQSPTANFTYSNNILCEKDTIFFINTSTVPRTDTIKSVIWSFGDGISIPNGYGSVVGVGQTGGTHLDPSRYYSSYGNKTVTMTVTSQSGCTATATKTLSMLFAPTVFAGNDTSICIGGSIQLNAITQAPSFTWNNGVQNNVAFIPSTTTSYIVSASQGACVGRDTILVTVNNLPTIDAGSDLVVCKNEQIILSATGGVNYIWSHNVTNNVGFLPSVGSTRYGVIGTDANGCENTDSVDVLVVALPTVVASNDTAVCEGQSVILSATGTAPSFNWSNGIQNGVAFQPVVSQWYFVSYSTPEGCTANDSVYVSVNAFPIVNAGNDITVCDKQSFSLQASGTAANYLWTPNFNTNTPIVLPVGDYTFILAGTSNGNCTTYDTVQVKVNPSPIVNAGVDQSICMGDSVVLNASGSGAPISWNNNVQNGTPFYPTQTKQYIVQTQEVNGCVGYDTVLVVVNNLPVISLEDSIVVCENTPIILSVNANGTISWSNGVQNGVEFLQNVGEQVYTVSVTDANNCSASEAIKVIVVGAPQANITANPTNGIAPLPVDFTNNSNGYYNQAVWNFGDNTTSTSLDSLLSHIYTQPGEYLVQ